MLGPNIEKHIINSPDVLIVSGSKEKAESKSENENQVIIHCIYTGAPGGKYIRIWPSTFLIARDITHRSELVLAENIPLYPQWMKVPYGDTINFSLIFTGLPKACQHFDLVEEIPEPGAFVVSDIKRNNIDVYTVIVIL